MTISSAARPGAGSAARRAATETAPTAARQAALERGGYAVLIAAVVWAPWPLGSNRPWALALLAALVWLGVLIASAAVLAGWAGTASAAASRSGQGSSKPLHGLLKRCWPLASLAGLVLLLVAQLVPGWGSDGGTLSIDPFATRRYLLATLTYAGIWGLVLLTVTSRERAGRLLGAVVAAGVLQAVVAVVLFSSGASYELWTTAFDQGNRTTGTFVNPDHLAGYMELTLGAGLGWLLSQFNPKEEERTRSWRRVGAALLAFLLSPKMLLRLALVAAVIALVMTHSRMGNGAFFLALLLVGALVAWRSTRLRRPALWLVASMALVDLLIVGQWVGLDRVVQRLKNTPLAEAAATAPGAAEVAFGASGTLQSLPREQSLQARLETPWLSLRLVAERPLLGHGGGSYATAFAPHKTAELDGLSLHWDHAHNDYVQVACDIGLVGLALWLSLGLGSAWLALGQLRDQASAVSRGVAVAALMALCSLGLHSMVDFNLHVPANALTFTVLLALPWAMAARQGSGSRRSAGRGRSSRPSA
jgi:O-antigen ligase